MHDLRDQLSAALVGRYVIERELGRGGMATVFRARDLKHDRAVALKVLDPELASSLGPERFLREIQIAARMQHPHIVPLFDSGQAAGFLFYVMPCVEGESLRQRLKRQKQLPVDDVLRITAEVASALAHAHAQDVVHRDVKPENILLDGEHALVADFGIARAVHAAGGETLTSTGVTVGTPAYMSPEQAAGAEVEARSDQYALGCVVYEMLAGQPPFTGPTAQSVAHQHLSVPPHPVTELRPTVPRALSEAIARALAKSPADRHADVGAFAAALADGARTPDAEPAPPPRPWWRTRSALAGAITLGTLAVIVTAVVVPRLRRATHLAPSPASVTSLVALPCRVYGNQEVAYLADAVPATMSSYLGDIPGVTTRVPPTSVEMDKVHGDLGRVARVMEVGTFVMTSVATDQQRLSLNVQIVDAATRQVLWSRAFQGPQDAWLTTMQDAAQAIRSALRPTAPAPTLGAGPTRPPAAEMAFREGQFYLRRYGLHGDSADFGRAFRAFQRTLELDPHAADAAVELGGLSSLRVEWGVVTPKEGTREAEEWIQRALRLDPRCGRVYTELYWLDILRGTPQDERLLGLALKGASLAPRDPVSQHALGNAISGVSLELQEACYRETWALEPMNPHGGFIVAETYADEGRFADALRAADRALLVEPRYGNGLAAKIRALCMLDRTVEAQALLDSLRATSGTDTVTVRIHAGLLDATSRDPRGVRRALTFATWLAESRTATLIHKWYLRSLVPPLVRSGRLGECLGLLEKADPLLAIPPEYYESQADFKRLRAEPRFQALLAQSRERARRWLPVLEETRAHGELPGYLAAPLDELKAKLGGNVDGAARQGSDG